jgi:hypothetical protein
MRIYLAGPMRGYPEFNRAAFADAAFKLRSKWHEVFVPTEHSIKLFGDHVRSNADGDEGRMGGEKMTIGRTVFHIDLTQICLWSEAVALLPGWEASKGASAEAAVGRALGIIVEPVERFL